MKNSKNELLLNKIQKNCNEKDEKIEELQRKIDALYFDLQTLHQQKPESSQLSQNIEQNINFIENGIEKMLETQVNFFEFLLNKF